jgi:glycosyltransferase involved in cell wall biosynthesis
MRFLFVSDFDPDVDSGAAGSLLASAEALEARGHRVDAAWREPGLIGGGLHRFVELPQRQYRRVRAALRDGAYDVVVVSQPYAFGVYEKLPSLHPRTLFLNRTHGWEDRLARADSALGSDASAGPLASLRHRVGRAWTHRCCARTARAAHGIICASSHCRRFIASAYRVPAGRLAVIPHGVTPAFLGSGPEVERGARRMLFVGQYLVQKGARVLETALPAIARRFPDSRVTFVVQDAAVDRIRGRYGPAFGARLTVRPWMPRDRLIPIYREHDVFLFPSLFEGFGKTFLEAMAAGACVVGSDEGGLPDVATNGEHALFGPPGEAERFSELLASVLEAPDRARAIGERARARAAEFTWARAAAETERFCLELRGELLQTGTGP